MIFSFVLLAILILAFSFDQKPKQYEYNENYQTIFVPTSNGGYSTATFTTKGVTYKANVTEHGTIDVEFLPAGKYNIRIYGLNKKTVRGSINKTVSSQRAF